MPTPEPDVSCFSPDVTPAPPIMLVNGYDSCRFLLKKLIKTLVNGPVGNGSN